MFKYMQYAPGPVGDFARTALNVKQAAGNLVGQHANAANQGALGARTFAGARDPGQLVSGLTQKGYLNEYEQTGLLGQRAAQDMAMQQQASRDEAAFTAGMANEAQNQKLRRQMWENEQMLKAQNVANQLNALAQTRQTNASLIASAMQTGANLVTG